MDNINSIILFKFKLNFLFKWNQNMSIYHNYLNLPSIKQRQLWSI